MDLEVAGAVYNVPPHEYLSGVTSSASVDSRNRR